MLLSADLPRMDDIFSGIKMSGRTRRIRSAPPTSKQDPGGQP